MASSPSYPSDRCKDRQAPAQNSFPACPFVQSMPVASTWPFTRGRLLLEPCAVSQDARSEKHGVFGWSSDVLSRCWRTADFRNIFLLARRFWFEGVEGHFCWFDVFKEDSVQSLLDEASKHPPKLSGRLAKQFSLAGVSLD